MLCLLVPALMGFLLALALGGSIAGWSELRVKWWALAPLALATQVFLYSPPVNRSPLVEAAATPAGVLASTAVLIAVLRNAQRGVARAAWATAALGIVLNLTVIVANDGSMPSIDPRSGERRTAVNTRPIVSGTHLVWLADTIVEPNWIPFANVVSPGDIVLSLGCAWYVFTVTRRRVQEVA